MSQSNKLDRRNLLFCHFQTHFFFFHFLHYKQKKTSTEGNATLAGLVKVVYRTRSWKGVVMHVHAAHAAHNTSLRFGQRS